MATNDRDDVTKKVIAKMKIARGGYAMNQVALDHTDATLAGMSEASIVNIERQLGGRITGGEGAGPARP